MNSLCKELNFTAAQLERYLPKLFPMMEVLAHSTKLRLFLIMQVKRLPPDCLILQEGDLSTHFFVCLEGSVNCYRQIEKK
jgi:CRP-like cAMP-binding protein